MAPVHRGRTASRRRASDCRRGPDTRASHAPCRPRRRQTWPRRSPDGGPPQHRAVVGERADGVDCEGTQVEVDEVHADDGEVPGARAGADDTERDHMQPLLIHVASWGSTRPRVRCLEQRGRRLRDSPIRVVSSRLLDQTILLRTIRRSGLRRPRQHTADEAVAEQPRIRPSSRRTENTPSPPVQPGPFAPVARGDRSPRRRRRPPARASRTPLSPSGRSASAAGTAWQSAPAPASAAVAWGAGGRHRPPRRRRRDAPAADEQRQFRSPVPVGDAQYAGEPGPRGQTKPCVSERHSDDGDGRKLRPRALVVAIHVECSRRVSGGPATCARCAPRSVGAPGARSRSASPVDGYVDRTPRPPHRRAATPGMPLSHERRSLPAPRPDRPDPEGRRAPRACRTPATTGPRRGGRRGRRLRRDAWH